MTHPSHLDDTQLNEKLCELLNISLDRWWVRYGDRMLPFTSKGHRSLEAAQEEVRVLQEIGFETAEPEKYNAPAWDFCAHPQLSIDAWHNLPANKQAAFGRHLRDIIVHHGGGLTNHNIACLANASARPRAEALYLTLTENEPPAQ